MLLQANIPRPLLDLDDAYLQHLAQLVAYRLEHSFGVPPIDADRCGHDVLSTLAREGTRVFGDADAFALLTPWPAADGIEDDYVAAIGWIGGRAQRAALLRDLWRYGANAGRRVRLALAPAEYAILEDLDVGFWTTSVFVRTPPVASQRDPLIRLATDDDDPFVLELLRVATARGFSASPSGPVPPSIVNALANALLAEIRGPDGICVIAAEGAQRLAHASGLVRGWDEYGEPRLVELHDVFVPPSERVGIGARVERAFLHEAFRRGGTAVEGHITVTNDAALVPKLLSVLAAKGWKEHRRLVLLSRDRRPN